MIEFGKTLTSAREAKGLSIAQLAETTHMAPTTVRELEDENFSRIAAPIYGRGFVKLYCEAVGIDPKPLIAEFMEIYNGERDPEIKERPCPEPPEDEVPPDESEPVADPPPSPAYEAPVPPPDLFHQEPKPSRIEEPPPPAMEEPPAPAFREPTPPPQEPTLSRYAAPVRQTRPSADPRSYLRLGILAVGVLVLLVCLFYGIRTVYRATTPSEEAFVTAETAQPVAKSTPEDKPADKAKAAAPAGKSERTPQKIPPFYID